MCETRREVRSARTHYRSSNTESAGVETSDPIKMPRATYPPRSSSNGEWSYSRSRAPAGDGSPQGGRGRGRGRQGRGGRGH